MRYEKCEKCGHWAASIALSGSAFLAVLKFAVGAAGGSKGLIADSLHSVAIFVTILVMTLGERLAKKQDAARFHYGYGKIQAVFAGSIMTLIACVAAFLIWSSFKHLLTAPLYRPPHLSALLMAIASIIANDMMARYLRCAASRFKSRLLLSYAWAYRENYASSIVVLVGIAGAELGFGVMDPIAALVAVAIVLKACSGVVFDSVRMLMDYSANSRYGDRIRSIAEEVEGVERVSGVRTRQIGQRIWLDLDICVNPEKSIREANLIAEKVWKVLTRQIEDLEKVMVNFGPKGTKGFE